MAKRLKAGALYLLGYPSFFLFFFVLGVYWTFPYERVRDYIVTQAQRGGDLQLDIAELSPSWLTGIHAEGIRIAMDSEGSDEPQSVELNRVDARISLLSLLGGEVDVDFETEFVDGATIAGNVAQGAGLHLDARFERINLGEIGPLQAMAGLPIGGQLNGEIDFTVGEQPRESEGSGNLTIRGMSVADGETPLVVPGLPSGGLTLERMNLGRLEVGFEIEEGVVQISELSADGEHAQMRGTGSIRLNNPIQRSVIDLLARLNFSESYRTSSPRMEGVFMLMDNAPLVRRARTPDGALQWRISGSLAGQPRFVPSGNATMPGA